MSGQRVLVCGGRDFAGQLNRLLLFQVLDELDPAEVIHGGARGADSLADAWALDRGVGRQRFVADWLGLGKAAGPARNQRMLEEGKPDLVVAFPGGAGTANLVAKAEALGIPVRRIPAEPDNSDPGDEAR